MAQLLDLLEKSLVDSGFSLKRKIAPLSLPHIQFLFINSPLCSTLPSECTSRFHPLRFSSPSGLPAWTGTFTHKLRTMPGTRLPRFARNDRKGQRCTWKGTTLPTTERAKRRSLAKTSVVLPRKCDICVNDALFVCARHAHLFDFTTCSGLHIL